jgi:hypothetical protein
VKRRVYPFQLSVTNLVSALYDTALEVMGSSSQRIA